MLIFLIQIKSSFVNNISKVRGSPFPSLSKKNKQRRDDPSQCPSTFGFPLGVRDASARFRTQFWASRHVISFCEFWACILLRTDNWNEKGGNEFGIVCFA